MSGAEYAARKKARVAAVAAAAAAKQADIAAGNMAFLPQGYELDDATGEIKVHFPIGVVR